MFMTIAFVALFAAIVVAAARMGAGSIESFVNLVGDPAPKRPYGTQEDDLAPFSFR